MPCGAAWINLICLAGLNEQVCAVQSLQAEDAAKVLLKNQENIVRKAAAGKVLTAAEKATLEGIAENAITAQELADALGISRRTIFYLRRNAAGPRSNNLEEGREFLETRSALEDRGQSDSMLPEELQKTKLPKL